MKPLEHKECQVDTGQNKFLLELRKERGAITRSMQPWTIAIFVSVGVVGVIILSIVITM